jgi:glycosyltransferase involved in cell wall biosynthesis
LIAFSIVIPVYNREREIGRAIESCLAQDFEGFEIVVVDDGSTDGTGGAVRRFGDARIKLIRRGENQGQGAARNAGADAAVGEWIVFLDSDDELMPGSLSNVHRRLRSAGSEIGQLCFMLQRDDGRISPLPAPRDEVMDYPSYLASLEGRRLFDFLPCTRRASFRSVRYPERRWSDHFLYTLDFAKRFRTLFCADVAALVHTDSPDRTSYRRRSPGVSLSAAIELAEELETVFSRHGAALHEFAPQTWKMYSRLRAAYHFLSGHRGKGFRRSLECLRSTPLLPEAWALIILGLANRRAFAVARSWRAPST